MNRTVYTLRRNALIARVALRMASRRAFPLLARHAFWRLVLKREYPGYAILGLTNRCDCNCQHCYAFEYRRNDTRNEMDTEEWFGVLEQIRALAVPRVHFSGGEPTLRDDLPRLVRRSRDLGMASIIETSGIRLDGTLARDLKAAGVDGVVVSLDSSFPERHDEVRHSKGLFDKAVDALRQCVAHDIPCVISTFANREKLDDGDLEGLMRLGKSVGVDALRLIPPITSGKWMHEECVRLTPGDVIRIEEALDPSIAYFRGMYFGAGCAALERGTFYVAPSGEIQPCAVVPLSFGSVREERLADILERIWRHPICELRACGCVMNDGRFRAMFDERLAKEPLPIRVQASAAAAGAVPPAGS